MLWVGTSTTSFPSCVLCYKLVTLLDAANAYLTSWIFILDMTVEGTAKRKHLVLKQCSLGVALKMAVLSKVNLKFGCSA